MDAPNSSNNLQKIRQLVATGKSEQALNLLYQLTEQHYTSALNDVTLVQNRFYSLNQRVIQGSITPAEQNAEAAKINQSILYLLADLDKYKDASPSYQYIKNKGFLFLGGLILLGIGILLSFTQLSKSILSTTSPTSKIHLTGKIIAATPQEIQNLIIEIDYLGNSVQDTVDQQGHFEIVIPKLDIEDVRVRVFNFNAEKIHDRHYNLSDSYLKILL